MQHSLTDLPKGFSVGNKIVEKKVAEALKLAFSKNNLDSLGEEIVRFMKGRVRTGFGVEGHKKKKVRLKPLKASTVASRRRKKRGGGLSGLTSPKKSNLTESGDMLDDLSFKSSNPGTDKANLSIDFQTEEEARKAEWHHEGAGNLPERKFMYLSDKEVKKVSVQIQEYIDDAIDKVNRK